MLDVDKQAEWENPITGVVDFVTKTTDCKPVGNNVRLLRTPQKTEKIYNHNYQNKDACYGTENYYSI